EITCSSSPDTSFSIQSHSGTNPCITSSNESSSPSPNTINEIDTFGKKEKFPKKSSNILKRLKKNRSGESELDDSSLSRSKSCVSISSMSPRKFLLANNIKVLKILSHWVMKYYIDFQNDEYIRHQLLSFVNTIIESEQELETKSILFTRANMVLRCLFYQKLRCLMQKDQSHENIFSKKLIDIEDLCLYENIPVDSCDINIQDFDSEFIAYGFTTISIELQKSINIRQFLNKSWTKANKHTQASSILRLTDNFNKTAQLIKSHILSFEKSSKRANAIEFWLDVAHNLLILYNYNILSMIMGAIESNPIYRLKTTWSKVSK
ncbi:hypothetical protein MXB_997, partial [Myxobolus squamalis]